MDDEVQRVVRESLADCTVLMIAHRLESIRDADMVVMMDGGSVVEVGDPRLLREAEGSVFRELWEGRHG